MGTGTIAAPTFRRPIDLPAMTRDVRNRCARGLGNLEVIAQGIDPVFPIRDRSCWS
jgi:hypothetical protein